MSVLAARSLTHFGIPNRLAAYSPIAQDVRRANRRMRKTKFRAAMPEEEMEEEVGEMIIVTGLH